MTRFLPRYTHLIVLLCGLVSESAIVFAHPPGPPSPRGGRLEEMIEAIGLDEKTLAEVKKIIEASKAEHKELHRQLYEAHGRMRSLLEQENPNEAAVMDQAEAIGVLETKVQKQRLRTMLQVRTFLTAEQRTKLLEMLRAHRPHGRRGFRSPDDRQRQCPPQDLPAQQGSL